MFHFANIVMSRWSLYEPSRKPSEGLHRSHRVEQWLIKCPGGRTYFEHGYQDKVSNPIWLWINTYKNTIFSGMNIHFNPAILMWTEGVQGFDTLPYVYIIYLYNLYNMYICIYISYVYSIYIYIHMPTSQNVKPWSITWTHRPIHTPDPYQNAGDPGRSIPKFWSNPIYKYIQYYNIYYAYTHSIYIYTQYS